MRLTSLTFRDTIKIKADYGELVGLFQQRLDEKYFKGFIDKDETQVFSYTGFFSPSLSPSYRPFSIKKKASSLDLLRFATWISAL